MERKNLLCIVILFVIFSMTASSIERKLNANSSIAPAKVKKPDLVALSMNVTVNDGSALTAGKNTMVVCKLKNDGDPFTRNFRIDIRMDNISLAKTPEDRAPVAPMTTSFSLPWVATPGNHIARCILDSQNEINESKESNNQITYNFNVPGLITVGDIPHIEKTFMDISIDKIEVKAQDGSKQVSVGEPSLIFCWWKRAGAQPENAFRVYIEIDGTPCTPPQGLTAVNYTNTSGGLYIPWTATAGEHQVYCEVDKEDSVKESNEENNKMIQLFNVVDFKMPPAEKIVARKKTDVLIEKVEVKGEDGSSLLYHGKPARIYCHWRRTGATPSEDFRVAPFVDGVAVGLPQGSTVQHELEHGWLGTPWTAIRGSHTIKCLADSAYQIAEDNEVNNIKAINIVIKKLPDSSPIPAPKPK